MESVLLHDAINDPALDWLDIMCLGRRIPFGKGSLVLLDAPLAPGGRITRQERLHQLVDAGAAPSPGRMNNSCRRRIPS